MYLWYRASFGVKHVEDNYKLLERIFSDMNEKIIAADRTLRKVIL